MIHEACSIKSTFQIFFPVKRAQIFNLSFNRLKDNDDKASGINDLQSLVISDNKQLKEMII